MHIPNYDCVRASCDYGNEKRQLSPPVAATTSTSATTLSTSTPTSTMDHSGKFTVTGPITLTIVTTLTSLPGSVTVSPSISGSSSSPQGQTTVLIGSGDLMTPTLSISSKTTTASSLETGSASSQLGVGVGPLGTSGRLSGTAILGIVLGAVVFLLIIALGLAFWKRRRSCNAVARQDTMMTSEWMDRWEDSVRMRRTSNARSANAGALRVDLARVQSQLRLPNPPSPRTKPRGSQKRAKKPNDSDTKTKTNMDTNTLTVQTPMTSSTSLPLPSSASTNTDRSLNMSPISPKMLTYPLNSALRTPIRVTVMYSFVPHLPDELPVKIGDQLRVIREFDDGWALCVTNAHGKQGMVPVECLAVTGALERIGEEIEPDLDDARLRNRGSSLEPLPRAERFSVSEIDSTISVS